MTQTIDYKKKYTEVQLELIDTKARLATMQQMYWKQQKMLNDDQADNENYKDLYLAMKQKNEELTKIITQNVLDPVDYKGLYESTIREKRKMIKHLSQEVEKYKAKYEQAKETFDSQKKTFDSQKKELIKKSRTTQSEREKRLRGRIDSLENLLRRYKEEGVSVLMKSDII